MTAGLVRMVLSDGLIHVARLTATEALCGARWRGGDLAAADASVTCGACLTRAILAQRGVCLRQEV